MCSLTQVILVTLIQGAFSAYKLTPAGHLLDDKSDSAAYYNGGDSILVVGGYMEYGFFAYSDISEYNILTNSVTIIGHLPEPRAFGGSGHDGNGTYFYFGGNDWVDFDGSIYKFSHENPNPEIVGNMGGGFSFRFPSASVGNGTTYLYNGYFPLKVYMYEAFRNELKLITHREYLPVYSMVYIDGYVYSLGSYSTTNCIPECTSAVVLGITKFSPATLQFKNIETVLGERVNNAVPVAVGTDIYLVGGDRYDDFELHKFDTITETLEKLEVESPYGKNLHAFSAVHVESLDRIYIFEGIRYIAGGRLYRSEIYYIQL